MVRDLEMLTGLVGFVQLIGRNLAGIADLTPNHERGLMTMRVSQVEKLDRPSKPLMWA